MRIAILGTRGIPNRYGGFEQFAEYLSVGLVKKGHDVSVYTPHNHPYREKSYQGVELISIYDPEYLIGTAGQFVYDCLSILDSRKRNYDLILQLGYTSSSIFFRLHPPKVPIITNMDGLEWKRSKYSANVQKFLQWAESLAVKQSDSLVADSIGIQHYLQTAYQCESVYIPYGSDIAESFDEEVCTQWGVEKGNYDMLIARLEPENSIETILEGVARSACERLFLVIGKHDTVYGEYLKSKYIHYGKIIFVGGVYDTPKLDSLRFFSNLYFHGHTVGGTNPSLLEAMGSGALICAHDNLFNRAILGEEGFYFSNADEITEILKYEKGSFEPFVILNRKKIGEIYSWNRIIELYEKLFYDILSGLRAR